ncbi:hypothetical protein PG984_015673 [Apiospora sp. TS-2023a]
MTMERILTPLSSPDTSASSPSPSPNGISHTLISHTLIYVSAPPDVASSGFKNSDGDLKLGLGLGIGIGLPLTSLMGLGCFLLWRLLNKTCPLDFFQAAAMASAEKQPDNFSDSENGYETASILGELMSTEPESLVPREILSTELYEAEGASKQMQPVELGI